MSQMPWQKVNQNMSYLDDSALERCTEYAYTLSDTFGYDIAESTRAADTLIKNYGVSAREAFNLITQGATVREWIIPES